MGYHSNSIRTQLKTILLFVTTFFKIIYILLNLQVVATGNFVWKIVCFQNENKLYPTKNKFLYRYPQIGKLSFTTSTTNKRFPLSCRRVETNCKNFDSYSLHPKLEQGKENFRKENRLLSPVHGLALPT